jgi:tRNA A37 threonylcarbamoyladenosine dehydratase
VIEHTQYVIDAVENVSVPIQIVHVLERRKIPLIAALVLLRQTIDQ